tara:strand:+ start:215 stop:565 length:351 start_codon:yes stop_codon:yes gene_type:complete
MRNYFTYNDEYISGWRYWWRSFLQYFLVFFLGLGLYLQAVTTYKRAKSLGHSARVSLCFALLMFLLSYLSLLVVLFPVGFAFPQHSTVLVLTIIFSIPHWYLWFMNGNPPERVTDN